MQKIYSKKEVSFSLPEELQDSIDKYIDYLNSGEILSEDCYQTEILMELNCCRREELLSEDQIYLLKQYYIYGGIHK